MQGRKRVLTGIKPTGVPHLGNYFGAIQPALARAEQTDAFLFIADLHALTTPQAPEALADQSRAVAATWLALGLDPERTTFYRQSDVPEILLLAWALACVTPLGLLYRGHSVKDQQAKGLDRDALSLGLLTYPVLMAADILAFDADEVPVGKDQKQHLEIAQEAARKFNNQYGADTLKVPAAIIDEAIMTVPGLDGRKMSKSYDNDLGPLMDEKALWRRIKGIATDSTPYGDPLPTEGDLILPLLRLVDPSRAHQVAACYQTGRQSGGDDDAKFGWGDAKKALRDAILETYAEPRREYARLMGDPGYLDQVLATGAEKARATARVVLTRVRRATGLPAPD